MGTTKAARTTLRTRITAFLMDPFESETKRGSAMTDLAAAMYESRDPLAHQVRKMIKEGIIGVETYGPNKAADKFWLIEDGEGGA